MITRITKEQKAELRRRKYYSMDDWIPEPTRVFNVGDAVSYGTFSSAVVVEVLFGGRWYLLDLESTKTTRKWSADQDEVTVTRSQQITMWIHVLPLSSLDTDQPSLLGNQDLFVRVLSRSIQGIIWDAYGRGYDMDAPYQRGHVWSLSDKQQLIISVLNNVDIGKISVVESAEGHAQIVVDGKQRVSALLEFYEDRFELPGGQKFSTMHPRDRNFFLDHACAVARLENGANLQAQLRYFLSVNCGRVMDHAVIDRAQEMLQEEIQNGA